MNNEYYRPGDADHPLLPKPADAGSLARLVEPVCPHGNPLTGNWYGVPPNVRWGGNLRCCGVAFCADHPDGAVRAFRRWIKRLNAERSRAERVG